MRQALKNGGRAKNGGADCAGAVPKNLRKGRRAVPESTEAALPCQIFFAGEAAQKQARCPGLPQNQKKKRRKRTRKPSGTKNRIRQMCRSRRVGLRRKYLRKAKVRCEGGIRIARRQAAKTHLSAEQSAAAGFAAAERLPNYKTNPNPRPRAPPVPLIV